MPQEPPDSWIDAELRQVPVPEGLLERLRRGPLSDEQLDQALREVSLPAGLRGRLLAIPPEDHQLDQRLRQVHCPETLLQQVKEAVSEDRLDDQSRDVVPPPPPPRPASRGRATWRPARQRRHQRWALATSLMLLIGGGFALAKFDMLRDIYRDTIGHFTQVAGPSHPGESDFGAADHDDELGHPPSSPPTSATDPQQTVASNPGGLTDDEYSPDETPGGEFHDDELQGVLTTDLITTPWGELLGQPLQEQDRLPELLVAQAPHQRGIDPPLDRGFDRGFLFRYGHNPVVSISENSRLRLSQPPLWTDTGSFDLARNLILAGSLPTPEEVHPEDFLAAGDYQFPLPSPGRLGLRTAAGPSPFGESGAKMLLVGVQAGRQAQRRRSVTHLVVAVDTSSSMQWGARLEMTRQALRQLIAHLEPNDRLSVVSFSDQATVLLEATGSENSQAILAAVAGLREGNGTHFVAGLKKAAAVAVRAPLGESTARELVLVTDGLGDLPQVTRELTEAMMADATSQGVQWTVLDLGRPGHASDNLADLAAAAGGRYLSARSAEEIRWHLVETLSDDSGLLARDALLHVEFNPRAVARYRLVGHAPNAAGLLPQSSPASLRSGQTAVALYEVWLVPGGENLVATARLQWRDPHTDEPMELSQQISNLQFALTTSETPLPLVTAQVLAEAAEILGQSPHVPIDQRDLAELVRYARSANSRLLARPSFVRNLGLWKSASEALGGG